MKITFKSFKYVFGTASLGLVFISSLSGNTICSTPTNCTISFGELNLSFGNNNAATSDLAVTRTHGNISNINMSFGDDAMINKLISTKTSNGNIDNTAIVFGDNAQASYLYGSQISYLYGPQTSNGNIIDNTTVTLGNNATIGHIYGAYGDYNIQTTIKNTTIMLNGTVNMTNDIVKCFTCNTMNNIVGGSVGMGEVSGSKIYIHNSVKAYDISNSIDTYRIIAGHLRNADENSKATNNLIYIDTSVDAPNVELYGGLSDNGKGDVLTGNKLYFSGKKGVFKDIANFEFIDISLENTSNQPINANDPILVLADKDTTDLSNTTISLKTNDSNITNIKIFEKVDGTITAPKNTEYNLLKGISTVDTFTLDSNQTTLVATKTINAATQEKTQNVGTAAMSEAESLLSGNDVIDLIFLGKSIKSNTLETFGMIRGGAIETTSGANTNSKVVNLIAGVGKSIGDDAEIGLFFEGGYGSYASETSTAHGISNGKGSNTYYGAGLLLSFNLTSSAYLEVSQRLGQIVTSYSSDNLGLDDSKVSASFDTTKIYYSAHIGVGNVFKVTQDSNIDLYVKAYYGQIGQDDVLLATNDKLSFSAVNSLIGKIGARYNYNIASNFALYGGASYEYEALGDIKTFNATADTYYNLINDKKSSYAVEAGTQILPTSSDNVILNVHAKYLMGARQGIAGSLKGTYRF